VGPAVHRTILTVDVAGFGDQRRTNGHQLTVRQGLYAALERAFRGAGIPWSDCDHEDRGDGVLVLIRPAVAKTTVVDSLPQALVDALRSHNDAHPEEERIRLRMAVHAGEVHYDDHGVTGNAVNLVFRLLDAQPLREALTTSSAVLAIIASSWFFDEVIWHSARASPGMYRETRVRAKETDVTAWIRLPESSTRPEPSLRYPARGSPVIPRQLPASTRQFVGRDEEIGRLNELLDGSPGDASQVIITAIDGTAGIGKTALATHWAHAIAHQFPDGQLHVNLRGFDPREPMEPSEALRGFLLALGITPSGIPAEMDAQAALYRSQVAGRRMLILLDNARSTEQVRPLLPGSTSCVAIVTSRNRLDGLAVREGAHRLALDILSPQGALALLAERIGTARLHREPRSAGELITLCGHLPLALSIAAARAAEQPTLPLSTLIEDLHGERGRLDALDLGEADLNLRAVFSWSYKVLSPSAARLFRLLGIHPGPDIDRYACGALTGDMMATSVLLKELVRAHLIAEYLPGRFRFHDLIRAYAGELSGDDPERTTASESLVAFYLRAAALAHRHIQPHPGYLPQVAASPAASLPPINGYSEAMAWFTAEASTLRPVVDLAAGLGASTYAWHLACACTTFFRRTGRRQERVAIHRSALTATTSRGDQTGQAHALRHLANAIARLGRLDDALEYLDQATELSKSLNDDSEKSHLHLAYTRVFEARGQPAEALEHAIQAWDIVRHTDDQFQLADVLTLAGRQFALLRRYSEALPRCQEALTLYAAIGHPEGEADVLITLGDIERDQGRLATAFDYYQRALELDRQLGDRYWEAITMERVAEIHLPRFACMRR
jgi:tetratricopeptide (TPR) repeat protein